MAEEVARLAKNTATMEETMAELLETHEYVVAFFSAAIGWVVNISVRKLKGMYNTDNWLTEQLSYWYCNIFNVMDI